jgi:hypothetical protein
MHIFFTEGRKKIMNLRTSFPFLKYQPPIYTHIFPSHSPRLNHPNNIWQEVQLLTLTYMELPTSTYHFITVRLKYSPQHSVLNYPVADRGCHVVSVMDPYDRILGWTTDI